MKIVAIVQARMGSSRLPGKVLRKINNHVLLDVLLKRLSKSKVLDQIVVATTNDLEDAKLVEFLNSKNIDFYRGSTSDVLDRYYNAALNVNAEVIVRITGDCPLVDPDLVDLITSKFFVEKVDYMSNTLTPTFPDGLDVEVFKFSALEYAHENAVSEYDREHVTPFIKGSSEILAANYTYPIDYSNLRWTVDETVDVQTIEKILNLFEDNIDFTWTDVVDHPKFSKLKFENTHIVRNEGAKMSKGQKLWKRAKDIIPGGNMLLSKRPEMFLPDLWPSYFSKASGCNVWDLDDNKFIDVSIMGIGTNLLGYSHPKVDEAVSNVVQKGNMSTLNCPEEIYLAERLVELHPWSDMVRFARSGGEANAIAVRIARAASGKPGVAICGYHGWHDWYLATNLKSESALNGHLLPGLEPKGVPEQLYGTVHPFEYNDIEKLQNMVSNENIGVIVMEVMRNHEPKNNFLQKVRQLASENGIVLIFDECTSGFRETYGGLHLKYEVYPDLAMFGKALGNGYAITSVIGRREVMEHAQSSFISSTFGQKELDQLLL